MTDRPPLDLDAITARARKAEVDTVNSLRHDVAGVIDALVGDSLALVARIRELDAENAELFKAASQLGIELAQEQAHARELKKAAESVPARLAAPTKGKLLGAIQELGICHGRIMQTGDIADFDAAQEAWRETGRHLLQMVDRLYAALEDKP